ncbi:MAG: DUF1361 domain-containing protein [Chloroflexota bacterium]
MLKKNTVLAVLAIASLFASLLAVGRYYFSDNLRFTFLIWNLFLAWLPVGFAYLAYRQLNNGNQAASKLPFTLLFIGLWLLFLPNAPYLVTDFVHLRPMKNTPLWYDALMIFSFAMTGLLLGFVSLAWLQTAVQQRYGRLSGWLFALSSLTMTGFGVYIGRFLRWNSWDILTQPSSLITNLLQNFVVPNLATDAWGWSLSLVGMLVGSYVLLMSWRQDWATGNGR